MEKRPGNLAPGEAGFYPDSTASFPENFPDEGKSKLQLEDEVKAPILEYKKDLLARRLEELLNAGEQGVCVEIRISPEYISVNHKPVKRGQLFGDIEYTSDSDLVAVLMHLGYFRMMDTPPLGMVSIKTIVRLLPGKDKYPSRLRNNYPSKSWCAAALRKKGCSYKVEGCWLVKRDGSLLQMQSNINGETDYLPTFVPASNDRTVATRSTTATAERRQRTLPEHTFMFNLSSEVCMKYSIFAVADRGLKPWQWTSARLHNEVMYLEDNKQRYELSLIRSNSEGSSLDLPNYQDLFSWGRCRNILGQEQMEALGVPLPLDQIQTLLTNLKWEDIKWSPSYVEIYSTRYTITKVYFLHRI